MTQLLTDIFARIATDNRISSGTRDTAKTMALPSEFVWMPVGTTFIDASESGGGTFSGKIHCNETTAAFCQRDLLASIREGRRVWIDFEHSDGEAAAWVKCFYWDGSRGVICCVDWTPVGEAALLGKSYYSFSPAFSVERASGCVKGLLFGKAAGGLVNAPAFGASMPALVAASQSEHIPREENAEQIQALLAGKTGRERSLILRQILNAAEELAYQRHLGSKI